ncbi:hypothetical protein cypCar_00048846, partial [Cyprinus carpio]
LECSVTGELAATSSWCIARTTESRALCYRSPSKLSTVETPLNIMLTMTAVPLGIWNLLRFKPWYLGSTGLSEICRVQFTEKHRTDRDQRLSCIYSTERRQAVIVLEHMARAKLGGGEEKDPETTDKRDSDSKVIAIDSDSVAQLSNRRTSFLHNTSGNIIRWTQYNERYRPLDNSSAIQSKLAPQQLVCGFAKDKRWSSFLRGAALLSATLDHQNSSTGGRPP